MFSKSFIVGIIVLVVGSVSLLSQCPTGYTSGGTVTVSYGIDCYVEATWCYSGFGGSDVCDIHFTSVTVYGSGCPFPNNQYGFQTISWDELVEAVLNSPDFEDCLGVDEPPLCGSGEPKLIVRISNGGCYSKTVTVIPPSVTYTPCDIEGICSSTYEFCKQWDPNLGKYVYDAKFVSGTPYFNCTTTHGCYPWCPN